MSRPIESFWEEWGRNLATGPFEHWSGPQTDSELRAKLAIAFRRELTAAKWAAERCGFGPPDSYDAEAEALNLLLDGFKAGRRAL